MKKSHYVSMIIFSVGILFLFIPSLSAQNYNCPEALTPVKSESTSILNVIGENDYPYFLNIQDLKHYSNIQYDGIVVNSNQVGSYSLISVGKNFELKATYGKDGKLIQGRMITKDARIPKIINVYLVDNYKNWTMISNKTVVNDFNISKTKYEVKLQQGKSKIVLFFDHSGKRV